MSTGSDSSTKSTRIVVIVVGVLIVAGAALIGRDVLARQAVATGATPAASATVVVGATGVARAPGGSEQTPTVVPGKTPGGPPAKGAAATGTSATATAARAIRCLSAPTSGACRKPPIGSRATTSRAACGRPWVGGERT